jgi:hypothetical protein
MKIRIFLFFLLLLNLSTYAPTHLSTLFSYAQTPPPPSTPIDHSVFTQLLKQFVNKHGLVDYRAFKKDKDSIATLNAYLDDLMKIDGMSLEPKEERMAYWLNLYNGLVLKEILQRYPVKTVAQIPHFLDERRYELAGFEGKLSLLDIEQKIFLEKFNDPRLHFARVNGSLSGPAFLQEAFQGSNLEKKLGELTAAFLSDSEKNYYDRNRNIFYASALFLWFEEDFAKWSLSNRNFIQSRFPGLPPTFRLEFMGYDWKLNDTKYR